MSGKPRKLKFHIKQAIAATFINDANDTSLSRITDFLLNTFPEYQLEKPRADEVRSIIKEHLKIEQVESTTPVYSLNRTLSNNYLASTSSKRKRQVADDETNPSLNMNNEFALNDISQLNNSSNKNISGKPKKRIVKDEEKDGSFMATTTNQKSFLCPRPENTIRDFAGVESILSQIEEFLFFPVKYTELVAHLGVVPSLSLLLQGPTGCGKTSLALAIANELNLPFYKVSGPELIGGASGESEERVRDVFNEAIANSPSIVFIDSIDVVASKKEMSSQQRGMDRRVVAQLCDSIDQIIRMKPYSEEIITDTTSNVDETEVAAITYEGSMIDNQMAVSLDEGMVKEHGETETKKNIIRKPKYVIFIAATNKSDSLDPIVRGRFVKELSLPVPDVHSRSSILKLMSSNLRLAADINFDALAHLTPGFVGSDLKSMVNEAGMIAVTRIVKQLGLEGNSDKIEALEGLQRYLTSQTNILDKSFHDVVDGLSVEMIDFIASTKVIVPSAKREGFAVVPDVTWADVGALAEVREELFHNVLEPIAHPSRFRSLGLEVPAGVLFFGPPGCGKTLLAKAIANQSGANFISVKGPELLNMYVGESESRVRQVFSRARSSSPCVIFFDEIDALCPKRGSGGDGGSSGVTERVVNQLLTELDGLETRKDVYIIAATNRLELIDEAILRPGRLGKLLYVPLPESGDRHSILKALTRKVTLGDDVNVEFVAGDKRADGFSGADLAALVREAGLSVVREWARQTEAEEKAQHICARHFEKAFSFVRPSVSKDEQMRFDKVNELLKEGMGAVQALKASRELITFDKHLNSLSLSLLQKPLKKDNSLPSPSASSASISSNSSEQVFTNRMNGIKNSADCGSITPEHRLNSFPNLAQETFCVLNGVLWCSCCKTEIGTKLSRIRDHIGVNKDWINIEETQHQRKHKLFIETAKYLNESKSTTE